MTFREALHVLIDAAAQHCAGSGTGLRAVATAEARERIRAAIVKVWPRVYGRDPDEQDLRNLGFRHSSPSTPSE